MSDTSKSRLAIARLDEAMEGQWTLEGIVCFDGSGIVLASERRFHGGGSYKVYATWEFEDNGNRFWGHYLDVAPDTSFGDSTERNRNAARVDFRERVQTFLSRLSDKQGRGWHE